MIHRPRSFRPQLELLEARDVPTTFVVNNFTDAPSTAGTLRDAIDKANNNPGTDGIVFSVLGLATVKTIQLERPLTITDRVTINGSLGSVLFPPLQPLPGIELKAAPVNSSSQDDEFVLRVEADGCSIRGLIINRGVTAGILLVSDGNVVTNCFIGTTANGLGDGGSQGIGILVRGSNNTIGGPSATSSRNVVGGNGSGVVISGFTGAGRTNTVQNNLIGLGKDGATAIPNSTGVFLSAFAANNQIVSNTISSNFDGVRVVSPNATGNVIRGNKIGVAADGVTARGNQQNGILVAGGAHNNTIGGTSAADANIIAFNSANGVVVGDVVTNAFGLAGVGNSVLGNRIFGSFNAIDLGNDNGGNANDPLDADTGPNNFQNTPILTAAALTGGVTQMTGVIDSTPASTFRIEFFTLDNIVNGVPQGMTFLGLFLATTDAAGHAAISVAFPTVPAGTAIAATATNQVTGDTSEFCALVTANTPPMVVGDALTPTIDEGSSATLSGRLVDPDHGNVLGLRVNWGDGTPVQTYRPGLKPFAFTHRYLDDGVYNVFFVWFDDKGGSNSRTRSVTVRNVAPILADVDLHGEGTTNLIGRIVDPGERDTFKLLVNWGDGTKDQVALGTDRRFHLQHRFSRAGTFTVTLTLTDDDGGTAEQSLTFLWSRSRQN